MLVQPINYNPCTYSGLYNVKRNLSVKSENYAHVNISPLKCDCVSFGSISSQGAILKILANYGVPDIYTGQILLPPSELANLQNKKIFDKPLGTLMPILSKYKDSLCPVEKKVFNRLNKISEEHPGYNLQQALQSMLPIHEKKLLDKQRPIFAKLNRMACEMPQEYFEEYKDLLYVTNKKISKDLVTLPFSAKEFVYKLKRIGEQIKSTNNSRQIRDMNRIIQTAKNIFYIDIKENYKIFGYGVNRKSMQYRLEYQKQPKILKRNLEKFDIVNEIFEKSSLRNNKELKKLFFDTSARIQGCPLFSPFQRKTFIYDLKQITKKISDKELAANILNLALKLPTSVEDESAFIVKYANDNCDKIGFSLFKGSICSVDHLVAKNNGGKNKLYNYGLCSTYTNMLKSNMPFDEWVKLHPETYDNCQKYVDKLIELYKNDVFEKISKDKKFKLTADYIYDFADTVKKISPKNKPLILDLSKLKD